MRARDLTTAFLAVLVAAGLVVGCAGGADDGGGDVEAARTVSASLDLPEVVDWGDVEEQASCREVSGQDIQPGIVMHGARVADDAAYRDAVTSALRGLGLDPVELDDETVAFRGVVDGDQVEVALRSSPDTTSTLITIQNVEVNCS